MSDPIPNATIVRVSVGYPDEQPTVLVVRDDASGARLTLRWRRNDGSTDRPKVGQRAYVYETNDGLCMKTYVVDGDE